MKTRNRRILILSVMTVVSVLTIFAGLYLRIERPIQITQLEVTVASLPLGVSQVDADNHMGARPDYVVETSGVLMSSVTMLTPENALADKYWPPHDFTLRQWNRDGVSAVVAIDTTGKVAGRWSWRPQEAK